MGELAVWLALAAATCGLGKHWLNLWYLWRARKSGGDESALRFAEAMRRARAVGDVARGDQPPHVQVDSGPD